VNRILLQREKVQVSRSFEVLGRQTEQKWKILEERGLAINFWNLEGKGG